MEFNKKKVTDFLSNNAIVILLVLLVLFVGFTRKGFFSGPNYSNIITNVTPRFIIALRRQRLSDHQGHGPVGWPNGRFRRRYRLYAAAASGLYCEILCESAADAVSRRPVDRHVDHGVLRSA